MSNPSETSMWYHCVKVTDAVELQKVIDAVPTNVADQIKDISDPALSSHGLLFNEELKRAYFLDHGPNDLLFCVIFDCIETMAVAEQLHTAIEARWPIQQEAIPAELLAIHSQVLGRPSKKTPYN